VKYSRAKVIDFLDNEFTNITWDEFVDMMHDKFGDECESMLGCMAVKFEREVLTKEATESMNKAVKLINEVF